MQPTMTLEVIDRILVDEENVERRVAELGEAISRDYEGKDLVLTCVLKGGVALGHGKAERRR